MPKHFEELIDVSLDEAARLIQKAINYGDYLAEQRKVAKQAALDRKEAMRDKMLIAKSNKEICTAGDAKARIEQAEAYAKNEVKAFEQSEIEADYIADLFRNNHDRIEALRTIISSKKQTVDHYNRNSIN